MAIIGIDLGTTNSLVSVYRNGRAELLPNEWGQLLTPSCVGVLEDGTVTVGAVAKERLITHPRETAASFKTWMGTQKEFLLGGKVFLPHELSALVLRKLAQSAREALGEEIEEAIISVPAYFNDNQRCATRLAAQLAGLPVKRLINEPSAAALYHSHAAHREEQRLLIVDFGGGTLDVSVVDCFENMVEIVAIAGNNRLGGNDIDRAIAAYFCQQTGLTWSTLDSQQQRQLLSLAERGKISLSQTRDHGCVLACQMGQKTLSVPLNGEILRAICQPIFQQVKEVIVRGVRDSSIPLSAIHDVVLVGGSSQMGVFVDYLEALFSKRPTLAKHPEHTVALGVGLCAGIKQRCAELRDLVMTDVCPFSLGVATYHRVKLILKIYRDVVWVLSERAEELHEYAWELGNRDADAGLCYLENFAPDIDLQEFEEKVCCVMESRMLVDVIDRALLRLKRYPDRGELYPGLLQLLITDQVTERSEIDLRTLQQLVHGHDLLRCTEFRGLVRILQIGSQRILFRHLFPQDCLHLPKDVVHSFIFSVSSQCLQQLF